MNLTWGFNKIKKLFRIEVNPKRFISDYEINEIRSEDRDKANKILDKISKSGIGSISKSEVDFLKKYEKWL